MKKKQTNSSKPAAASTPKQKPRSLEDKTSPSATLNDTKKCIRELDNTLSTTIKKLYEAIDVINKNHRDIIRLKVRIEDSMAQIGTLRFMIVTTVLIALFALIFAGIAHARINSLKGLLPQTTTYDTTSSFKSTAN